MSLHPAPSEQEHTGPGRMACSGKMRSGGGLGSETAAMLEKPFLVESRRFNPGSLEAHEVAIAGRGGRPCRLDRAAPD